MAVTALAVILCGRLTVVHGSTVTGTGTEVYDESFGYNFDYQASLPLGMSGWHLVSGSGSGTGAASSLRDGSGSGTYSASFDNGLGTLDGTNSVAVHDGWEYSHQQDYLVDRVNGG